LPRTSRSRFVRAFFIDWLDIEGRTGTLMLLRRCLNKPAALPPRRCPLKAFSLLPLECLRVGEWAEVADVAGDPGWVGRMAELGLRVGVRVQMLRGGSPCLVLVGESRLSLRGESEVQILVQPVAHPA
jgi:ferrous iron transport protein A